MKRLYISLLTIILSSFLNLTVSGQSVQWQQRVSQFDYLGVKPSDIVMLGNSITAGGNWSELLNRSDIKNRGISGDIIPNVLKRLDNVVAGKPRKIFLLIGINDISHSKSAVECAADYQRLVEEIRRKSPQTELYLQSVLPIDNSFKTYKNLIGKESVIPELNLLIKEIAAQNQAVYIDLWPAFASSDGKLRREFTNDGLHLLAPGYAAWIDILLPYLK